MGPAALIYDVHGNLPALEAALADAEASGAGVFYLGGDYALFGAWSAETVGRLRELENATWIRGNGERWTADPTQAPEDETVQAAISACRQSLGEELVRELAALPEQTVKDGTRYCHGSPISDLQSFGPEPTDDEQELLGEASEQRIVFGHTHLPFVRRRQNGVELINPGSVGMPFDGDPRAAYALLHDDGSVEHRRVDYQHAASAEALQRRYDGAAWTGVVARRILTARF